MFYIVLKTTKNKMIVLHFVTENNVKHNAVQKWCVNEWLWYEKRIGTPHKKRFYNRETNSAAFCALQWMSLPPPSPFYATQIINPFLNSRILSNHDKVERF